jgi:hypothetical protein
MLPKAAEKGPKIFFLRSALFYSNDERLAKRQNWFSFLIGPLVKCNNDIDVKLAKLCPKLVNFLMYCTSRKTISGLGNTAGRGQQSIFT